MAKLIYNAVQCKKCNDVIVSYHVHDYKECSCGECMVDGGLSYIRRSISGNEIPLDKYDDVDFIEMRNYIHWGVNYDKNKKRLPETRWMPIKDLQLSHLEALIDLKLGSEFYKVIFIKELQYRMLDEEIF